MHDHASWAVGGSIAVDDQLEREFEVRLVESSTLAFRVAYAVLRQREDAEDVAQDAFAKAYRHFRHLRERDAFRAWLVRMTWRLAIDRQRADRRRVSRESTQIEAETATDGTAEVVARERAAQLWSAIDALPEKLRVVVILSGIEGYDVREVARLLKIPDGTVKSRLFLARQRLKEQLQWTITDHTSR